MDTVRRHKRYKIDHRQLIGKMTWAEKVEVMDISSGGIRITADSRLNLGKEYVITLGEQAESVTVKCVVIRAELSGTELRSDGAQALIYTVALKFKDDQAAKVANILKPFKTRDQAVGPAGGDRRREVRFQITMSSEVVLNFPAQFTVKVIGMGGMSIRTELALETNRRLPMELSLEAGTVEFIGRVASCARIEEQGQEFHDIGVEFTGLAEKDRTMINAFIDYLAATAGGDPAAKTQ